MTQSRINPNIVHSMDAELYNKQMAGYRALAQMMAAARLNEPEHMEWVMPEPFKLTQAAQFDGPMNSLIASYARRAIMLDYSYAEYVQYAQAYSKVTVISEPEYVHAKLHAATHAWAKGLDESFFKALAQGVAVIEVSVDEQDNILLKHWDANMIYKDAVPEMLFNQRNHTQ